MSGRGKGRQLRVDAQRNRELIMAAARAMVSEHGPDVSMEEVARASGVGVGTLYRRFGSRDALIAATAEAVFERVMANVHTAAEATDDPWRAFSGFVTESMADLRIIACLSTWYPTSWEDVRRTEAERERRRMLLEALGRLVDRAQADGAMRGDVSAGDVAVMLAMVLRPQPGRWDDSEATRRYLALTLDAFRAGARSPLPGIPTTLDAPVRQTAVRPAGGY